MGVKFVSTTWEISSVWPVMIIWAVLMSRDLKSLMRLIDVLSSMAAWQPGSLD